MIRQSTALSAACLVMGLIASPSLAQDGDIAAGEKGFKKCQSCHVVMDDEGNTLAGRASKTGPNLYGIVGRTAGSVDGFKYGKSIVAAGEAGLVWDEETFMAYVADPRAFLKAYLDDSKAKSKMTFKLKKPKDALNIYTFLGSLAE